MLQTDRLRLRHWLPSDSEPFARMNADQDVMRYFEKTRTRQESDDTIGRLKHHISEYGFGFWAAELRSNEAFVGFVGMQHVPSDMPFAPAVEIGWRLDKAYWGQGLAPEAARACLVYAFSRLQLEEMVSFTAKSNMPSRRVMEKIGMKRDATRDFDHPAVSDGSDLKRHVFYSLKSTDAIGM